MSDMRCQSDPRIICKRQVFKKCYDIRTTKVYSYNALVQHVIHYRCRRVSNIHTNVEFTHIFLCLSVRPPSQTRFGKMNTIICCWPQLLMQMSLRCSQQCCAVVQAWETSQFWPSLFKFIDIYSNKTKPIRSKANIKTDQTWSQYLCTIFCEGNTAKQPLRRK